MADHEEIDALRAQLAEMQAQLDDLQGDTIERGSVSRRRLLMGLAGASAAAVAGVGSADPAAAADGNNLVLGQSNSSSAKTELVHTTVSDDHGDGVGLSITSDDRLTVTIENTSTAFGGAALGVNSTGTTSTSRAIWAIAKNAPAVAAENASPAYAPTVTGTNSAAGPGLGAWSQGAGPQLYLETHALSGPAPIGPPSTGVHGVGGIRLDAVGDLWVCTEDGTPGTWTRLLREDNTAGRVIPITPTRALDTRAMGGRPAGAPAVPGQKKGPLKGGTGVTLDLAGVGPIPADATGVVGNLTVTNPSFGGYLMARPSGATSTSSALNWVAGATTGNSFTCQLGPAGLALIANGSSTQHYELIVDITAFIT